MKYTSAQRSQVHPFKACPVSGRPVRRISLFSTLWIFAVLLLAACGNPTEASGPALLPTVDSSETAAPPPAAISPSEQATTSTLAPPVATAATRNGATLTPWPTNTLAFLPSATPAAGTPWPACRGSRDSRLRMGAFATVSKDPPQANNVRDAAGANQLKVGQIQPGERVKVIDGPDCVEHWTWWKIQSQDTGLTGWTAEGDEDNYWLVPEN